MPTIDDVTRDATRRGERDAHYTPPPANEAELWAWMEFQEGERVLRGAVAGSRYTERQRAEESRCWGKYGPMPLTPRDQE